MEGLLSTGLPHLVSSITKIARLRTIFLFFFLTYNKFYKVVELVGGGSVINGAYPTPSSF